VSLPRQDDERGAQITFTVVDFANRRADEDLDLRARSKHDVALVKIDEIPKPYAPTARARNVRMARTTVADATKIELLMLAIARKRLAMALPLISSRLPVMRH
jgi:hypothetical protein